MGISHVSPPAGLTCANLTRIMFSMSIFVSEFLEWLCNGSGETDYGGLGRISFPNGWGRPNTAWCTYVFGHSINELSAGGLDTKSKRLELSEISKEPIEMD